MSAREEKHDIYLHPECSVRASLDRTQQLRDVQLSHFAMTGTPVSLAEIALYSLKSEPQIRPQDYTTVSSER